MKCKPRYIWSKIPQQIWYLLELVAFFCENKWGKARNLEKRSFLKHKKEIKWAEG
jgi:hypothetical protein